MSVQVGWNAKILLAERGIWKAPQLVDAFEGLGITISREHAWRLMSKARPVPVITARWRQRTTPPGSGSRDCAGAVR